MGKTNEKMKLTLASRLNIALCDTGNDGIFMLTLEHHGLVPDYHKLINDNVLSIRLYEKLYLMFSRKINFDWLLLGRGDDMKSYHEYWNELWYTCKALREENEALKDKLSKLQGGREPEPMKGKVIKMNFK
ncbi:MAG: hypothetical protein WCZ43_12835 [Proteiniphilum sp.]